MEHEVNQLMLRVAACEEENKRLRKQVKRQSFGLIGALLVTVLGTATASIALKNEVFGTIQARDITIVDKNGVVRARMSGDMPDAVMFGGRVVKRGTETAGFMIYDKDGYERGGYVTFDHDHVMLSLDSKHHMVLSMIAGPDESGVGVMNIENKQQGMEMRLDRDGPRLSVSKGRVVQQQIPAIEQLAPETCTYWRKLDKDNPGKNVCRSRYTETACQRCLSEQ